MTLFCSKFNIKNGKTKYHKIYIYTDYFYFEKPKIILWEIL